MDIARYTGPVRGTPHDRYVISFTRPISNQATQFTGWQYPFTWEGKRKPCLYVGNRQAGPDDEVEDLNDSVIEGVYTEYEVAGSYETDFKYSEFGNRC